ncbi:hypothetical protein AYO44_01570 [Planctomycetaceae bacterium SCGC AG-212-F19]|nr:hypothetical protein AYO44_01570 [Planctomycetaceae bacterium SCGC AG-212-F19]
MRKAMMAGIALLLAGTMARSQEPGSVAVSAVQAGSCCACEPAVSFCDRECSECAGLPRFWAGSEYLMWWVRKGPLPFPLVTTGDPNDNPPGALGQPGTQVLFGGSGLDYGTFSGLRATVGGWFDPQCTLGLELSGFLLERRSVGFAAASDATGNPPLYVPVFNVSTGAEGSFTIADPLFGSSGNIAVVSALRLWGYEANVLRNLRRDDRLTIDLLLGYRYLQLAENLHIDAFFNDFLTDIQGPASDQFSTRNSFSGGQLGGRVALLRGPMSLELLAKVALGNNHERVSINGLTFQSGTGLVAPTLTAGGILTAPTNIGTTTHDEFSVIPQVGIKAGYNIRTHVRATVGYDFLYWSSVVRPGDEIDRVINPTQQFGGTLVGEPRPIPLFNRTGFVAHGVSFGLDLEF